MVATTTMRWSSLSRRAGTCQRQQLVGKGLCRAWGLTWPCSGCLGAPNCFTGSSPVASELGADPTAFPLAQGHGAGSAHQGPGAPRAHMAPLHSDHIHVVSVCRRTGFGATMPKLALPAAGPPTSPPICVHQRQPCSLRCLGLLGPPAGLSESPPSRVGTHQRRALRPQA